MTPKQPTRAKAAKAPEPKYIPLNLFDWSSEASDALSSVSRNGDMSLRWLSSHYSPAEVARLSKCTPATLAEIAATIREYCDLDEGSAWREG